MGALRLRIRPPTCSTRKRLVEFPEAEQHDLAAAIQAPDTVSALTGAITRLLQQGLVRPAAPAGA